MPIDISILPDRRSVYARFSGVITLHDIRDSHERYLALSGYAPGQTQIFDAEAVREIDMDYAQMNALVAMTYARYDALPMITHATIYAPHDIAFGMARMFELAYGENPHYRILVTRSDQEALEWCGYPQLTFDELRTMV